MGSSEVSDKKPGVRGQNTSALGSCDSARELLVGDQPSGADTEAVRHAPSCAPGLVFLWCLESSVFPSVRLLGLGFHAPGSLASSAGGGCGTQGPVPPLPMLGGLLCTDRAQPYFGGEIRGCTDM